MKDLFRGLGEQAIGLVEAGDAATGHEPLDEDETLVVGEEDVDSEPFGERVEHRGVCLERLGDRLQLLAGRQALEIEDLEVGRVAFGERLDRRSLVVALLLHQGVEGGGEVEVLIGESVNQFVHHNELGQGREFRVAADHQFPGVVVVEAGDLLGVEIGDGLSQIDLGVEDSEQLEERFVDDDLVGIELFLDLGPHPVGELVGRDDRHVGRGQELQPPDPLRFEHQCPDVLLQGPPFDHGRLGSGRRGRLGDRRRGRRGVRDGGGR